MRPANLVFVSSKKVVKVAAAKTPLGTPLPTHAACYPQQFREHGRRCQSRAQVTPAPTKMLENLLMFESGWL